MTSIRLNLLKWLIAPLLIINLIGAGLTYWLAWTPTQIAFDQNLADTASALAQRVREVDNKIVIDLPQQAEQVLRVDHLDVIYFVVRNSAGKTIAGDNDFPLLRVLKKINEPQVDDGEMRNEPIRVTTLKTLIGSEFVTIGVGETLRKRTEIRSVIFVALILLEGLLALVSIGIVWFAVSRGLAPLKKMQADLNARNHNDLSPVRQDRMPIELRPVINAINGLLKKVQIGANAQQDFLANVAHQLRTPLAGLRMQLEWVQQRHENEPETAHSARLMMVSTDRMVRQTNQLLTLARAEPSQFEKTRLEIVELDKLVEESIQHFVEEADKKNIDLGFDLHPARVRGDWFLLRDLIDNLIDNAIRYSPEHGAITVSCFHDGAHSTLSVEDIGPGIPESQRELIFNRFYRLDDKVAGSGLGLAIVRDIVNDHGAEILLTPGAAGKGTIFSVVFPAVCSV